MIVFASPVCGKSDLIAWEGGLGGVTGLVDVFLGYKLTILR
jgi:hypothetical protein